MFSIYMNSNLKVAGNVVAKQKTIEDFSRVYVERFVRDPIPESLTFPNRDYMIFVGPYSDLRNSRPPKEVITHFKRDVCAPFEYEGWKWELDGNWREGFYTRSQDSARDIVLSHVDPYLDTLESLVGKEVLVTEVLPIFSQGRKGSYRIPGTIYSLTLDDEDIASRANLALSVGEQSAEKHRLLVQITSSGEKLHVGNIVIANAAGLDYSAR